MLVSATDCRRLFVALAEQVFRDLYQQLPPIGHDPRATLVLTLTLDGVTFAITHDATDRPDWLRVAAHVGVVGEEAGGAQLEDIVAANHPGRHSRPSFGLDADSGALLLKFEMPLLGLESEDLLCRLHGLAAHVVVRRDAWELEEVTE